MTNNKLTDEQLQEIYGEAVSCELAEKNGAYMACFDLLCKMDDVGGTAHVVRKMIDMLRSEWVELQELRRNYLALRGEIEDVRSQLYEAENQANEYASELQERRKAEAEPVAYMVGHRLLENMTQALAFKADSDLAINPLYAAQPAPAMPVVPEEMTRDPDVDVFDPGFMAGWNACRAAMLQGGQPVSQTYELPQTQFEQVADLYEMQFDDGRTCAFHTDGAKAAQWLLACDGNKVQEYVRIERYQEAVIGNSPAITDDWVMVPKQVTPEISSAINVVGQRCTCGNCSQRLWDLLLDTTQQGG